MKLLLGVLLGLALGVVLLATGRANAQARPAVFTDFNSTLAPGEPRIAFRHSTEPTYDFEWGFYQYGPAFYSLNKYGLVEFWVGDQFCLTEHLQCSTISVKSRDGSRGGAFQARDARDQCALYLSYNGDVPRVYDQCLPQYATDKGFGLDPGNGELYLGYTTLPNWPSGVLGTPQKHAGNMTLGMNQYNKDPTSGQVWVGWDIADGNRKVYIAARPPGDTGTPLRVAEFDGLTGKMSLRHNGVLKPVEIGADGILRVTP